MIRSFIASDFFIGNAKTLKCLQIISVLNYMFLVMILSVITVDGIF